MKKIIVIIGHTGCGKSTLCKSITAHYNAKLLSFAMAGKSFSKHHGYKRIRDCYFGLGKNFFVEAFSSFFSDIIDRAIETNEFIIIDGLYEQKIALQLKNEYSAKFILIDAPISTCLSRIAKRNNLTYKEVKDEYQIKESLKESLGNSQVLEMADISVDGNMPASDVYHHATKIIDDFLF